MWPGPAFKRILDAVYDAQLEGEVTSKDGAMEMAMRIAVKSQKQEDRSKN